jgi:hypothetical protein
MNTLVDYLIGNLYDLKQTETNHFSKLVRAGLRPAKRARPARSLAHGAPRMRPHAQPTVIHFNGLIELKARVRTQVLYGRAAHARLLHASAAARQLAR